MAICLLIIAVIALGLLLAFSLCKAAGRIRRIVEVEVDEGIAFGGEEIE